MNDVIEQIRAEIERRYKKFDGKTGDFATASRLAYLDVLSFLDILQDREVNLNEDFIDDEINKVCDNENWYRPQDSET